MNKEEQRESLRKDLQNVIDRHLIECDLFKAEIIGVIESVKLDCFLEIHDEYSVEFDPDGDEEE